MQKQVLKNYKGLSGVIKIPADKSVSHRAIMFSSLAKGKSLIRNFSKGQDPNSTLKIFQQLGVNISFKASDIVEVDSSGSLNPSSLPLCCDNSGTTMRLISGILAGQKFNSVLTGDESLSKRPMKRIIEPLKAMGANIESDANHAPLKIYGSDLSGIKYSLPIASAQVKSCLLLAGLNADGITTVSEPYLSRNHTELMLKYMGADIEVDGLSVSVKKSFLDAKEITVCGDISSAAYFIVAALIVPGSDIILKNVGLNPTRCGIIEVVEAMGGDIKILEKKEVSGELVGDIRIRYSALKGCRISGDIIPRLIDELPVIAVLATQADGETVVSDAGDLRNKESDRIVTTVSELKKLGANIDEKDDGFVISGKSTLCGGCEVESYNDHRLAMSLYVAGLISQKGISINGFEWAGISFPEFDELFSSLLN